MENEMRSPSVRGSASPREVWWMPVIADQGRIITVPYEMTRTREMVADGWRDTYTLTPVASAASPEPKAKA